MGGHRLVAEKTDGKLHSAYLKTLDAELRSDDTPCKASLLDRLDVLCAQHPRNIADLAAVEESVLEGMLDTNGKQALHHRIAVRLGVFRPVGGPGRRRRRPASPSCAR